MREQFVFFKLSLNQFSKLLLYSSLSPITDVDNMACISINCYHDFVGWEKHLYFVWLWFALRNLLFLQLLGLRYIVVNPYLFHCYKMALKLLRITVDQRWALIHSKLSRLCVRGQLTTTVAPNFRIILVYRSDNSESIPCGHVIYLWHPSSHAFSIPGRCVLWILPIVPGVATSIMYPKCL